MCAGTEEPRLRGLVVGFAVKAKEDQGKGGGASRGSQQGGVARQLLRSVAGGPARSVSQGSRAARSSKGKCDVVQG